MTGQHIVFLTGPHRFNRDELFPDSLECFGKEFVLLVNGNYLCHKNVF